MGCHCWTYKTVESLTDEEKQYFVNKELDELKNWWGFKVSNEKVIKTVTKWFNSDKEGWYKDVTETPKEYALNMIQEFTAKLNDVQEKGFDAIIANKDTSITPLFKEYNNKLYININFDYPCRVYGYPEEEFTDVNEFIEWMKITKHAVGYYEDNGEFISGFTEGLEKNIRSYFKKHGESNLLIKFG